MLGRGQKSVRGSLRKNVLILTTFEKVYREGSCQLLRPGLYVTLEPISVHGMKVKSSWNQQLQVECPRMVSSCLLSFSFNF